MRKLELGLDYFLSGFYCLVLFVCFLNCRQTCQNLEQVKNFNEEAALQTF